MLTITLLGRTEIQAQPETLFSRFINCLHALCFMSQGQVAKGSGEGPDRLLTPSFFRLFILAVALPAGEIFKQE